MSIVLIDAFDSFVYIIEQYLAELDADRTVLRSAPGNVERVAAMEPDLIVLGPGPGHPVESGHVELVERFAGTVPLLGVCLGHQAIGVAFGATVSPAQHIMHGKTSTVTHDGRGVFSRVPSPLEVTRYHSLIVEDATVPDELEVTSRSDDDGYIMGLRHRSLPIESVQFHPESVGTHRGMDLLRGYVETYVRRT
jgi:anthranilate synthase/aminodeoxychorismate synthase-like glutamine amidotransferase